MCIGLEFRANEHSISPAHCVEYMDVSDSFDKKIQLSRSRLLISKGCWVGEGDHKICLRHLVPICSSFRFVLPMGAKYDLLGSSEMNQIATPGL